MSDEIQKFFTDTNIVFRPFLASREEFFKGAILLENNSEFILRDNLFFNTNIKYSLADNFDDLIYPPATTFPAQVRSDVKDYLKNQHKEGILIEGSIRLLPYSKNESSFNDLPVF